MNTHVPEFKSFSAFSHYFMLAKLATSSTKVKEQSDWKRVNLISPCAIFLNGAIHVPYNVVPMVISDADYSLTDDCLTKSKLLSRSSVFRAKTSTTFYLT